VSALDWAIVGAFLAASLVLGLYLTRRASGNTGEYFLSGRNLPWWLAGTSMVATSFSADTPLYVTSLVRGHGVYENWQWWCFALSGMLAVSFFSRLWRRAGVVTDVELIDLRYSGRAARFLRGFKSVYFSCIIHTIIKAQVILAMVKILDVTLGWGKWESVIASSLVTLAYSTLGGLWGVVLTDFVQFILAMVGSVALAVVAVDKAGGLGALHAQLPPDVLSFFPPVSDGEAISTAFMAFLGYMGLSWWSRYSSDGGGVVVQRIASCRSEREGYLAAFFFNVANYGLRTWPWVLAALASLLLYPAMEDHEAVYPRMVMELLPSGMRGLMIASFFGAFMSTLSTYLNLSSAYFVNDFYRPFLSPGRDERHYVSVSRWMTIVLSILTAMVTVQVESIVGVFKFLIAFGSGTGLVYLVRWFWWRVNPWSEISAMLASTASASVVYLAYDGIPFYAKLAVIIGVSTAVWVPVTFLTAPTPDAHLGEFLRRVKPGGPGWAAVRERLGMEDAGETLGGALGEWAMGSLLVIGLTIGTGKLLLGFTGPGLVWMGLALISGWRIWARYSRV
jgi:Na+/proline symporter